MKTLTKQYLEELYYTHKNEEVCKILKITKPTLMVYLKKLNIAPKGSGNRTKGKGSRKGSPPKYIIK